MPPAPWLSPPDFDFPLGRSAMSASVVSISEATEAAFCNATRTTLVGSMTPAFTRSSYSSVAALKPNDPFPFLTLSTTIAPSRPALAAIVRMAPRPHGG